MKIYIVCATRFSETDFHEKSALGQSMKPYVSNDVRLIVAYENQEGLPAIYNRVIETLLPISVAEDIFIFCHDDIHVLDFFWIDRLLDGLSRYDVVGVAGSAERLPFQPSWLFSDTSFQIVNQSKLSGVVGHGTLLPPDHLTVYGSPDQPVELLDGLFLAVQQKSLMNTSVRFDEVFNFHFYDLDFCRTCRDAGLRLGTVALSLVHQSEGNLSSDDWRRAYCDYIKKWEN